MNGVIWILKHIESDLVPHDTSRYNDNAQIECRGRCRHLATASDQLDTTASLLLVPLLVRDKGIRSRENGDKYYI